MTRAELEELKAIVIKMNEFQGKTVWNQVLENSGMFKDDYMVKACNPYTLLKLLESYERALAVIEYYRGGDYDETSWMNTDQYLMYWTLWNNGDNVGGAVADDFLRSVGET